jgi:hypothetical protein
VIVVRDELDPIGPPHLGDAPSDMVP